MNINSASYTPLNTPLHQPQLPTNEAGAPPVSTEQSNSPTASAVAFGNNPRVGSTTEETIQNFFGSISTTPVTFLDTPKSTETSATQPQAASNPMASTSTESDSQVNQFIQMLTQQIQSMQNMLTNFLNMQRDDEQNGQNNPMNGNPMANNSSHKSEKSHSTGHSHRADRGEQSKSSTPSEKNVSADSTFKKSDVDASAAASKSSAPSGPSTSQAEFEKYFDIEGDSPYRADGSLEFDAMKSKVITENGNGIRNEMKIKEEDRLPLSATKETFSASVTPELSPGTQTIISQWHGDGNGALAKLYVDDQQKGGVENGIAEDGIFDVYAIYDDADGTEKRINFGTIEKGESLDIDLTADGGDFTFNVNGQSEQFKVADDENVYFKFGSYLQTKDPYTGEKLKPSDGGLEILEKYGVTEGKVTFDNVQFSREVLA